MERIPQAKMLRLAQSCSMKFDDDDDDDILFMLSNIIKYVHCTMKHEKERDTTTNVKHAESIERVEKEKKWEPRPRYLKFKLNINT